MMKRVSILLMALSLVGCGTISSYRDAAALKAGYIQKSKAESKISQVRAEYEIQLADNEKVIKAANDKAWKTLMDKLQLGSNLLYGADFAFILHPKPDRTHLIMDNKVNEARVLMPPPTIEAMAAQNIEVKRMLDETITSLESLQAAHRLALKESARVNEIAAQAQADLERAKQEKLNIEAVKARELAVKQADLDKANDAVIASEHERGNNAKARHELLTKLSMGAGLLAALCTAGAIFSPLMKMELGLASAVFGVAAVGVWYLTGPVVLGIVGVGGLAAILSAVLKHRAEYSAATDTYRAIQRIKDKSPEQFEQIVKPELVEANTKYVKQDGAIVKIPDAARAAFIDKRLAEVGDK